MDKLTLTLPGGQTIQNPEGLRPEFNSLGGFLTQLYNVGFLIATFLALFWLTWGVFEYIFAGGNKEKLATARGRITWAIIGLIFVLMAFLIAQYAGQVLLPAGSNQPASTLPI